MSRLPLRDRVTMLVGVFFTFAPVMVISVSSFAPTRPRGVLLFWAAVSGAIGAMWAFAGTHNRRLLPLVAVVQAAVSFLFAVQFPAFAPIGRASLSLEGLGTIVCIAAGYVLLIRFIRTQARRSVRLETEIALAQQIHAQLVPDLDFEEQGYRILGRSSPSAEVGGDLVDAVRDGEGIDLYLGDVTGHGVRSGVVMAMTKAAVHTARRAGTDLSRVLGEVNEVLAEQTDPGIFVTFAALRALPGGHVRYALAGHLPILHWRAASGSISRLENESLPLGIVGDQEFPTREAACEPGDLLVVLTDGFIEVAGADGRQIGLDGFERMLVPVASRPLREILDEIATRVRGVGPIEDDQTLLLLRVL